MGAMFRSDPAFEVASVKRSATIADHVHVLCNAFLQARGGHDDLESRAGRELSLNGFVQQRMIVVVDQLAPLIARDPHRKIVGIKSRPADHRVVRRNHNHLGKNRGSASDFRGGSAGRSPNTETARG